MKPNRVVKLVPWSKDCLSLLFQQNEPEMMTHLGGPETEEQIINPHNRYLKLRNIGVMYRIISDNKTVGSVGYWESSWKGKLIYEMGWSILSEFQGKGLASAAVSAAIQEAQKENKHEYIHAFPSIKNTASNAICRKLQFTLVGSVEFEYPPGSVMYSNDWKRKLS